MEELLLDALLLNVIDDEPGNIANFVPRVSQRLSQPSASRKTLRQQNQHLQTPQWREADAAASRPQAPHADDAEADGRSRCGRPLSRRKPSANSPSTKTPNRQCLPARTSESALAVIESAAAVRTSFDFCHSLGSVEGSVRDVR